MKKIIRKLDVEMYKLGKIDPKLALKLWYRICENKTILNNTKLNSIKLNIRSIIKQTIKLIIKLLTIIYT